MGGSEKSLDGTTPTFQQFFAHSGRSLGLDGGPWSGYYSALSRWQRFWVGLQSSLVVELALLTHTTENQDTFLHRC